jgi:hypothetical protein
MRSKEIVTKLGSHSNVNYSYVFHDDVESTTINTHNHMEKPLVLRPVFHSLIPRHTTLSRGYVPLLFCKEVWAKSSIKRFCF